MQNIPNRFVFLEQEALYTKHKTMNETATLAAQQVELTHAIDTVWVALCAALIFQMEGGFALLEAGFVRSKNAISIIAKVMIDIMFGGVAFYLVGFGIAYGKSNGYWAFDTGIMEGDLGLGLTISNSLFWFIQMGFAVAAISIVSGGVAERMKMWSYAIYVAIFSAVLYPLAANWVWNPNGWLALRGFNDFAGSAAIHAMGGFAALAGAIVLGPRLGKYNEDGTANAIPGHNLTLSAVGAFILWFGWFGFNAGSALAANGIAGLAFLNTQVATAGGLVGWLLIEKIRNGHATSLGAASGAVAGLVAITPACAFVAPWAAVVIGLFAGIFCALAVGLKYKFGLDDSLDVVGVHLIGGIWGSLAVGLFGTSVVNSVGVDGLFYGGGTELLAKQGLGVGMVALYSFLVTLVLGFIIEKTIGFRVSKDNEVEGVDLSEHAETAYEMSSSSRGGSY